jgi:hypothetical protein
MASKRQFLDPIGAGCRLILLYFSEVGTKIRIADHTIQLVPNNYVESMIYRPWIYGDSRDDMCVLYPAIVRFIELYLIEKKNKTFSRGENTPHEQPNCGLFEELDDEKQLLPTHLSTLDNQSSEKCYECLKKMAKYIINGLTCLEKTYGYDNAAFTLQYFSNLLFAGINGTYSNDLLPSHLKDSMYNNLLDISKIKNIWSNDIIIQLADLFEKCFDAHKNGNIELVNGFKAAIHVILNSRDEEFKKIVSSIDNA